MILRLPIPANEKYLTAEEIKTRNEWCARLAQLQLLGATLENEVEVVAGRNGGTKITTPKDEVPAPFAEHPTIKCSECGNAEIRKFSLIYYARHVRPLLGFNKAGEIGVGDDQDWDIVSRNDKREESKLLAGNWLCCHDCGHEMPEADEAKFDWY